MLILDVPMHTAAILITIGILPALLSPVTNLNDRYMKVPHFSKKMI